MLQTDRFPEDTIIIEEAVIPAAVFEAAADTGKFSIINSSSSDVAWSEDSSSVPKSCLQSKLSHSKKNCRISISCAWKSKANIIFPDREHEVTMIIRIFKHAIRVYAWKNIYPTFVRRKKYDLAMQRHCLPGLNWCRDDLCHLRRHRPLHFLMEVVAELEESQRPSRRLVLVLFLPGVRRLRGQRPRNATLW